MKRLATGLLVVLLINSFSTAQPMIFRRAEISDDQNTYPGVWDFAADSQGRMYAAAGNLGVVRSVDDGEHWEPRGMRNEEVLAVAVDHLDRVVAGSLNGHGVFRSSDDGQTWEQIGLDSLDISALLVVPTGEIYAAAGMNFPNVVYRSDTSGTGWTLATDGILAFVIWEFHALENGNVLVATSHGVFITTNGGESWAQTLAVGGISFAESADGALYVAGEGVHRSTDGGHTWELVWSSSEDQTVMSVSVGSDGEIFAGLELSGWLGGGVYQTVDTARTWQLAGLWGMEARDLSFTSQGSLLIGIDDSNENGIFVEVDGGDENLFVGQWNVSTISDRNGAVSPAETTSITVHFGERGTTTWFIDAASPGEYRQFEGHFAVSEPAQAITVAFDSNELVPSTAQASFETVGDSAVVLNFDWPTSQLIGQMLGFEPSGDVDVTLLKNLATIDVTLASPANGATEVESYSTFSWQPLDGAAAYHLQVGSDAALTSLVVDDSTLTAATYIVSAPLAYSMGYYWHVRAALDDGLGKTTGLLFGPWSETRSFTIAVGTATESEPGIPTAYALHPAYPNPFNPSTTIGYDVPETAEVRLIVFDALGRVVEVLGTRYLAPGTYSAIWDASAHPSGMYFVRMEAGAFTQTRRMILTK